MWIRVRSIDGTRSHKINDLSKLTTIDDLTKRLEKIFDAAPERQRLFYAGKQLAPEHTLFDYNVGLNDVVQILIKPVIEEIVPDTISSGYESCSSTNEHHENEETENEPSKNPEDNSQNEEEITSTEYYTVGDHVDAKEIESGSWYESKIVKIMKKLTSPDDINNNNSKSTDLTMQIQFSSDENCYTYHILYEGFEDDPPTKIESKNMRPRARQLIKANEVKIGDVIMANYNVDEPSERGFWYDVCVTSISQVSRRVDITGTLLVGINNTLMDDVTLTYTKELFKIEKPVKLSERSVAMDKFMQNPTIKLRQNKLKCKKCQDNPDKKCRLCACIKCGGKDNPDKQILCDECDASYHIWCLKPALEEIPEDEWYCPTCKIDATEVVNAGEQLKKSKKKSKMASAVNSTTRDWGKGMACVGKMKQCTIVPIEHRGPIPNVPVGSLWRFRIQVSEAGIHRPHVAGIHGRANGGAFSIVMACGYEDDVDNGDEFTYTGSGGRDLSGNKRTAGQSRDQTLTKMNKALALNCNTKFNDINGGEATDWKKGRPVRVVRSASGRKHSKYCPQTGNRYDGIYKVVKYWPETGKSGFKVWRYLLRRDDSSPAPWTTAGKKMAEELGLFLKYPEGYNEKSEEKSTGEESVETKSKKRKKLVVNEETSRDSKRARQNLSKKLTDMIERDTENEKLWKECLEHLPQGITEFTKKVEEMFTCVCCQEVVFVPVTTSCGHNICQSCLSRSFKASVFSCPVCRFAVGKKYKAVPNEILREILKELLPGYETGR